MNEHPLDIMAKAFASMCDLGRKVKEKTESDIGRPLTEDELKLLFGFMFLRILEAPDKKGK